MLYGCAITGWLAVAPQDMHCLNAWGTSYFALMFTWWALDGQLLWAKAAANPPPALDSTASVEQLFNYPYVLLLPEDCLYCMYCVEQEPSRHVYTDVSVTIPACA